MYCLGALRGLWGFCVREWLGGYMTCCVFASMLSSRLPFVFFSCPLVLLSPALLLGFLPCLLSCSLSCFLCFVAWLLVVVALFPFGRTGHEKRGAFSASLPRLCVALILSNINPCTFRLGFQKIWLYWCKLSGCGRFLLSLPACVPALLPPSNTGRCFRGLPALLG